MRLGRFEFAIGSASFRYITACWSGPGWDFNFRGRCLNDDPERSLFSNFGLELFTEASPLPLVKADDYTGVEVVLPGFYDEESGEPYFGISVGEIHDAFDVQLRFIERDGRRYLFEIRGTASRSIFGQPEPFELLAWAEELPDHSYLLSS